MEPNVSEDGQTLYFAYFHDATWRSYFGPGGNLPHADYTSGQYSDDGSHGCINMTLSNASWLYNWVGIGTPVVIY